MNKDAIYSYVFYVTSDKFAPTSVIFGSENAFMNTFIRYEICQKSNP